MLTTTQIERLSTEISKALAGEKVELHRSSLEIAREVAAVISANMNDERQLNAECDKFLDQYAREIDRGDADPHKLFLMIKKKIAKEKGFVL
jgi:hypothetical protein